MYPNLNVNGVGGTDNSGRSNASSRASEQNQEEIQVFNFNAGDSGNRTLDKLRRTRELADEAAETTKSHMERIKYYMNQGLTMSQAIQMVEDEEGGVSRENLVNRLVKQGFDRETAEKLIPKNIDARIERAREEGRIAGEQKVQQLDQKLDNIRNGRY